MRPDARQHDPSHHRHQGSNVPRRVVTVSQIPQRTPRSRRHANDLRWLSRGGDCREATLVGPAWSRDEVGPCMYTHGSATLVAPPLADPGMLLQGRLNKVSALDSRAPSRRADPTTALTVAVLGRPGAGRLRWRESVGAGRKSLEAAAHHNAERLPWRHAARPRASILSSWRHPDPRAGGVTATTTHDASHRPTVVGRCDRH
jgi:hypothetical protein